MGGRDRTLREDSWGGGKKEKKLTTGPIILLELNETGPIWTEVDMGRN